MPDPTPPPDDLFSGPHPAGCDHGTIEEHYDLAGDLVAVGREDLALREQGVKLKTVTYPCPRCNPAQHARWAAGCYRTDGSHDRKACQYCQEDGRHDRRI